MAKERLCITTDCVCDLPDYFLKKHNIHLIYFYVNTDTGRFRDRDEISAQNIFEYYANNGRKCVTTAPMVEDFSSFLKKKLQKYEEVLHIATSDRVSKSMSNCITAIEQLGDAGKRVQVFDSKHLSSGLGLLVLRAAELLENGCGCDEIIEELTEMRERISTSFISKNADYLYMNGRVNKNVKNFCNIFKIHPVLKMKDGEIKLNSFQIGDYQRSALRYVRKELKKKNAIEKEMLFVTHAGCTVSDRKLVRQEIDASGYFDEVLETNACATVSGNCGPRTFGLLYAEKRKGKKR